MSERTHTISTRRCTYRGQEGWQVVGRPIGRPVGSWPIRYFFTDEAVARREARLFATVPGHRVSFEGEG